MLGHGVRCIFLTAPLSYAAVALSFGQYEKRLRHENSQPVISSICCRKPMYPAIISRSLVKVRMIWMFTWIALGLLSTLESMATPCSVKTYGGYRLGVGQKTLFCPNPGLLPRRCACQPLSAGMAAMAAAPSPRLPGHGRPRASCVLDRRHMICIAMRAARGYHVVLDRSTHVRRREDERAATSGFDSTRPPGKGP